MVTVSYTAQKRLKTNSGGRIRA